MAYGLYRPHVVDVRKTSFSTSTERRVGVIGAGVSGLAVAKIFTQQGFNVQVFERARELGGVWAKHCTYPDLTTQTPGDQYTFSDHPMPSHYPDWPSAAQVREYLRSYSDRFNITEKIRFATEVTTIERPQMGDRGWKLTVRDGSGQCSHHTFDFVVICNGTFSTPNPASFPDEDRFRQAGGKVLHSTAITAGDITDRRVIVVGLGKSAADLATFAAERAKSVDLVFRRLHWLVPRFFGRLVHARWVVTSRLWESLLPPYEIGPERAESTGRERAQELFFRAMEEVFTRQFGLGQIGMRPSHRFGEQVTTGFCVAPEAFYAHIRAGRIATHRQTISHFTDRGVVLGDGEEIAADVVILATGFRQDLSFLPSHIRSQIIDEHGRYRLYRYLLNPALSDLGFVGYNNSLFSPLTSELGALWLAQHFAGRRSLPKTEAMNASIDEELQVGKAVRPMARRFIGINVAPYTFRYLDTLLADMCCSPQQRGVERLFNFVKPFAPSDYARHVRRLAQPDGH